MSRLYDRVFSRGTISPYGPDEARATRGSLEKAVVIAADEVARFFFAHEAKGPGGWKPATDIPSLAPPYRSFFVEAAMPEGLSPAWSRHLDGWPQTRAFGALLEGTDFVRFFREDGHPVPEAAAHARATDAFRGLGAGAGGGAHPIRGETDGFHELLASPSGAGARWLLQAELFLDHVHHKKILTGSIGAHAVVASDGTLCPTEDGPGAFKVWTHPSVFGPRRPAAGERPRGAGPNDALLPAEATDEQIAGAVGRLALVHFLPLLLAVSFANCKNVVLAQTDPDEKRSRRHKKKHHRPLVAHKTLLLDPMKEVLGREGDVERAGIRHALHLCRGHFRTYAPEHGGPSGRPLEEPYTEWVSPHARGGKDPGAGAVHKDYEELADRRPRQHETTPTEKAR